jgi:hypothetical protein
MNELIAATVDRIHAWHARWPNAAVLWSGGKDSTAMLHVLLHYCGLDLPIVQYREPKLRERYAYSDRLIKEWGLTIYDYPPTRMAIADGPDVETGEMRFDMLKYYQWGQTAVVMSLGTERPKPGERYLCGVTDFLQRPTGNFNWPWEAVYIGTKYEDTDLIKGHVPLALDIRNVPGGPVSLYPMRDWSDKDIYTYLEDHGVTPDPTRYIKTEAGWVNNPDKSLNADFYPTCFNCVDRHQGPHVDCPKLKARISNISHLAPYEDIVFPDLGFKPIWNTTANPAEPAVATSGAGPCSGATAPTPPASLPTTSAPTTPCSRQTPADAASPSVARLAEESPAQFTNTAHPPAEHLSPAAHSA